MKTILIKNGMVYDGLGGEPYRADLLLRDGRIAAIGSCEAEADLVIDAAGKVVCPGFVDIHRHCDAKPFNNPDLAAWNWRRASPPRWWATAVSA